MDNSKSLLSVLLFQLILSHEISANTCQLFFSSRLTEAAQIYCIQESKIEVLHNMHMEPMNYVRLLRSDVDDDVACEISVRVPDGNGNHVNYTKSVLVSTTQNHVEWDLQANGMWIANQKGRGFKWAEVGNVWPPSLEWTGARNFNTAERLKEILRRVQNLKRGICRVKSKLPMPSKLRCIHRHEGVESPMYEQEVGPNENLPLPIDVWDELVVCEIEVTTTANTLLLTTFTYKKYALLYISGAYDDFRWSLENKGLFLNGEGNSKFDWHDINTHGWPITMWATDPNLPVSQTLHQLHRNYMRLLRHLQQGQERSQNYNLEFVTDRPCTKISNDLGPPAMLSCFHSQASPDAQEARNGYMVSIVVPSNAQTTTIQAQSADEFMVCRIQVSVINNNQTVSSHVKYALLYYPFKQPLHWSLNSRGLLLSGEDKEKFGWSSSTLGWPISLWSTDPKLSISQTLHQLLTTYMVHEH